MWRVGDTEGAGVVAYALRDALLYPKSTKDTFTRQNCQQKKNTILRVFLREFSNSQARGTVRDARRYEGPCQSGSREYTPAVTGIYQKNTL